ncbi:hypothetical protein P3491_36975 [Vibrio parahaemolyticus]|uniref:hypothetical protein n=1 Tax=Vibrio mimicus TaxID=674 RepID=UPI001A188E0E|nr:hypothetical protein [Vibrio parahaemolyticus]HAS3565919.1 hypothetical protein [Vibrio cholerae]
MKKLLFLLALFTFKGHAAFTLDLTDPKNLEVADMYPSYELLRSLSFEDTGDSAMFGFKLDKSSEIWDTIFVASISANMDGKQKVYIYLALKCSDKDEKFEQSTHKTNGQNVRYYRFCDGNNVYMTPVSKAGDNYLVNEFKKKDNVSFEFPDIRVIFDAAGFTKRWNSYGGDAL